MLNKTVPIVLQSEASDCGFACIAMVCKYHGMSASLPALKSNYGSSVQGTSLYELHSIATDVGFSVRGIQFQEEGIKEVSLPAIVHWSGQHFVVLESVGRGEITIVDPAFGRTTITIEHAKKYLTGFALEIISGPSSEILKKSKKENDNTDKGPSIFDLIRGNIQIWPLLSIVSLGAFLYQLLSLSMPYLVSLVIDKAVSPRDPEMLVLIIYVFSGFFLAKIATLFINSRLQANLHYSLNLSLFSVITKHILSLPYSFFIRRSAADIHARLKTLESVRLFFASGVFQVPFSALYTVIAVGMMFYLESMTALIALLFIFLTILLEIPAQMYMERRQKAQIQAEIEESKAFVSSMLRIDHIKLNNSEQSELADITELQKDRIYADRGLEVASNDIGSIIEAVRHVEKLVLVFMLATQAMSGTLSVGLAIAFLMFTDETKQRLLTIVSVWSAYRATRVQLERIHEITIEPPEFERGVAFEIGQPGDPVVPEIQLHSVNFSYQKFGDAILKDISMTIAPGDKVVLYGPSGSGKSTLLRVISSLLPPSEGLVSVNGRECIGPDKARLRRLMGGLFAEDRLTEGTIFSNLVKDNATWKEHELESVLKITGLDSAIENFESGINTLILGDGRGVSSGQAQRILLARSLLKAPKVLLLDEPTSHCDAQSTANIIEYLSNYDGTVIVCTHNPEFLSKFTKVYSMTNGQIKDLSSEIIDADALPT